MVFRGTLAGQRRLPCILPRSRVPRVSPTPMGDTGSCARYIAARYDSSCVTFGTGTLAYQYLIHAETIALGFDGDPTSRVRVITFFVGARLAR